MNEITLGQVSAAIAFIVAFGGGLSYILKPIKVYNQNQKDIDERFKKIEDHQDNDNKRLAKLEKDTKQILLSVDVLLSHSIDNNHNEQLEKRSKELHQYLIER